MNTRGQVVFVCNRGLKQCGTLTQSIHALMTQGIRPFARAMTAQGSGRTLARARPGGNPWPPRAYLASYYACAFAWCTGSE
jgi:hypothetical protein